MPDILALLQNQWFKDPERARRVLRLYEDRGKGRSQFIRDMLFLGCLTGRRIDQTFGDDLLVRTAFEEVSPEIGGHASSVFPPDEAHVLAVVKLHQPRVIVAFGKVAGQAVRLPKVWAWLETCEQTVNIVFTCHPAARGTGTVTELRQAAGKVREWLNGGGSPCLTSP